MEAVTTKGAISKKEKAFLTDPMGWGFRRLSSANEGEKDGLILLIAFL